MNFWEEAIQREQGWFEPLVREGLCSRETLDAAAVAARERRIDLETILRHEMHVPCASLLKAMETTFACRSLQYDERLPVPPELLAGLDPDMLCVSQWIPVMRENQSVIIAARNPHDPRVRAEVARVLPDTCCEFRVALGEDIRHFLQDFLNSPPQHIIGNERTGLAHWRNTMARWRTKLACIRTNFAKVRTQLSLLRWGFGLIGVGSGLLRLHAAQTLISADLVMIGSGVLILVLGLFAYFKTRMTLHHPPRNQTLVEVTQATLYFLEKFQFVEQPREHPYLKSTMLGRLDEQIAKQRINIEPSLDNKVRSLLAHERTLLAGQRTVAGCYRTIYARARTGLSFIRTGITFISIGLGFFKYFGFSPFTLLDLMLILGGLYMAVEGAFWYLPARREHAEAEKTIGAL